MKKLWNIAKRNKLLVLAGVFSAAEVLVTMGVPLPGTGVLPQWARALAIAAIVGAAFVLRTLAARAEAKLKTKK